MFSQKIVDFVAQRRADGVVVAIIELDDRTHNSSNDSKRDSMLASAGFRVVRWHSKAKPDIAAIRAQLTQVLAEDQESDRL
jgi:very-short-patch-repair endonuclease